MKPKLIVILGPTAVGKSEIALELAEKIDAEIINADSQQVYRFMDIGTAKPRANERQRVRHHIIDVVEPNEQFSAALYRRLALQAMSEIRSRGKRMIVCGGTGLYIRALTRGLFVGPSQNRKIRERLGREFEDAGLDPLYHRLVSIDPGAVSLIHPNDRQRIIRALEVFELTGKPISEWQKEHGFGDALFETIKIGLNRERGELYDRINQRCDAMIQAGLVDEVRGLLAKGYSLDLNSLRSVGYRHAGLYLSGAMSLEEAVSLMKRDTRRLAKRQLTWFRRDTDVQWFHPATDFGKLKQSVQQFLAAKDYVGK